MWGRGGKGRWECCVRFVEFFLFLFEKSLRLFYYVTFIMCMMKSAICREYVPEKEIGPIMCLRERTRKGIVQYLLFYTMRIFRRGTLII